MGRKHKHILLPSPKIEVRMLYGLEDFYNKQLTNVEQRIWDLFVFYHLDIDTICVITNVSRRSISWRIRKISNKVWFYASEDLVNFYLQNAGYKQKQRWRPYPKCFTKKQRLMYQAKIRGVRKFVNLETYIHYRNQKMQVYSDRSKSLKGAATVPTLSTVPKTTLTAMEETPAKS